MDKHAAQAGDVVVIHSNRVGQKDREGVIVEVKGRADAPAYRVRWDDDDHESLLFPSSDAEVRPGNATV
ncbi:MAG TPA: DUF1918 domain-containing protein [Euzebya sp.]|nr:DUF1918 domain-containing protein [Euzebya sp.]